jgi:hypothetical protein
MDTILEDCFLLSGRSVYALHLSALSSSLLIRGTDVDCWSALSILLQAWFGPRTDFEKEYPRPTITDFGAFDLVLGRPPKVHIHIQHGATQFVCQLEFGGRGKGEWYRVGSSVKMREQGKYLKIRGPGQRKWVKLRLVSKSELHNL